MSIDYSSIKINYSNFDKHLLVQCAEPIPLVIITFAVFSTKYAAVITIAIDCRFKCRSQTVCGKSSVNLLVRIRKIVICFFTNKVDTFQW